MLGRIGMETQVSTRTLDDVICESYVEFKTPVDRIVASPALSKEFASLVNSQFPRGERRDVETINWRLMTLRKRGEDKGGLPRLERAYYGREVKKDRKPKPR